MDVYMTIYRGETAKDEIEINIKGHYDDHDNSLEVLEVTNTFDNTPVNLTPEERRKVATEEFDQWLESEAFLKPILSDRVGKYRKVYWAENADVVRVPNDSTFSPMRKWEVTNVLVEEYDEGGEA